MAGSSGFSVTVSVVDRASKQLDGLNRRIAALAGADQAVVGIDRPVRDVTGLTRMGQAFGGLARFALDAFMSVSRLVPALGALTGAASVAGLMRLTTQFAQFGSHLQITSRRIGVSTEQLQGLQGAARLAGTSADALTNGVRTLQDNLVDAVGGRAPAFIQMMHGLHVEWRNADGSARKMVDVLPEVADRIARPRTPTLQAEAATELFGSAAEDMLPFLRQGSAGIVQLTKVARKYNLINEDGAKAAQQLRVAETGLNLAVEGLSNSIGARLAPILTPLLNQFSNWIALNREWIATGIAVEVKKFVDYIGSVNRNHVGASIKSVAENVQSVAAAFGGWQRVAEGVAIYLAGAWFARVSAPLLAVLRLLALIPGSGVAATVGTVLSLRGDTDPNATPGGFLPGWVPDNGPPPGSRQYGAPFNQPSYKIGPGASGSTGSGANAPRGIRNNNPLNLSYLPGQGAMGSDGRFGVYKTMEAGVAAAERQLLRYQEVYKLNTVRGVVNRWAPPSENNTGAYVAAVSNRMGVYPDSPLNLRDQATASSLISAMAQQENGRSIDAGAIGRGVAQGLGAPMSIAGGAGISPAAGAPGPSGTAELHVKVSAPPGTTVGANNSGDIWDAPVRVHTAMTDLIQP